MTDPLVKLRYLSVQIKNIIQYFILKYSNRRTNGYLAGDHIHFLPVYIIISKKFFNWFWDVGFCTSGLSSLAYTSLTFMFGMTISVRVFSLILLP